MKKGKCDSCNRESENVVVHASLGPYSTAFCPECEEKNCFPIWLVEGEVKMYKNLLGARVEGFRKNSTVYENGEYIIMEDWLVANRERFIKEYNIT